MLRNLANSRYVLCDVALSRALSDALLAHNYYLLQGLSCCYSL